MCSHIVVTGVSGSGKSAVAEPLAAVLGFEFIEADEHHPPANIEKMAAGIPLTDDDRRPWLDALARLLAERHRRGVATVLACSALRRAYRDVLRAAVPPDETFVIQLSADAATLEARMRRRRGHYMPASLLASQLATLEPLERDEAGVTLDATPPLDLVVADAATAVLSTTGQMAIDDH
jgi:gluconokinase